MAHDVYVFGDSHWRVFFPFVNHGAATDNVSHELDGIKTIDTIANELSGSTMWGLLNPNSRHGARNRILNTIDSLGGVDNVGLVFGEVDARFHHARYFVDGARLIRGRVLELLSRYSRFIEEDLLDTRRVRKNVFVYHGFRYPHGPSTLLQPSQPIGKDGYEMAADVNAAVGSMLSYALSDPKIHLIQPYVYEDDVSNDGVHLIPERIYRRVHAKMRDVLCPESWEITF